MQVYSRGAAQRTRQLVADVVAVVLMVGFVVVGVVVGTTIAALGDVGRSVENAGSDLRTRLEDAATTLGRVPLVGDAASAPLRRAGAAGSGLVDAGQRQQELVSQLGVAAGLGISILGVALVLAVWLRPRLRFVRRAAEARLLARTDGGLQLLAFRALATADTATLLRLNPNPVAAWSAGDDLEQRQLAELALRSAGVMK